MKFPSTTHVYLCVAFVGLNLINKIFVSNWLRSSKTQTIIANIPFKK